MNSFKRPVFIDVGRIFRGFYSIAGLFVIYSFLVVYVDVSASVLFDYMITYMMYAEIIFGVFTVSAWVCLNVLATKLEGVLLRIPKFKFASVLNVWELYFLAWRKYTSYGGFILAVLLALEKLFIL